MLLFVVIPAVWLSACALVLGLCRMAARGDAMAPARATGPVAATARKRAPAYSPRRPTTCGTVRSNILTSVHNDQLAT
jgi:hypothetical protein